MRKKHGDDKVLAVMELDRVYYFHDIERRVYLPREEYETLRNCLRRMTAQGKLKQACDGSHGWWRRFYYWLPESTFPSATDENDIPF